MTVVVEEVLATPLRVALGTYPHTVPLKAGAVWSRPPSIDFLNVEPINRAFAPMVRELRYDICEMAIATFLLSRRFGYPLVLLPVDLYSRDQEGALLCMDGDRGIADPGDLSGKRIGVRSYSQTTGLWLRGILQDDYGVAPGDLHWVVTEGAHVPNYADPPFVRLAPAGADLLSMMRQGELDAIVAGGEIPTDNDLKTVFPSPAGSAEQFRRKHGFQTINHVMVASRALVESRPNLVVAFLEGLEASFSGTASRAREAPRLGCGAIQAPLDLAIRYAIAQELLPRHFSSDGIWAGFDRLAPLLGEHWK